MDEQQQDETTRTGFAPITFGRDVHVHRGGGALLMARRDMHVTRGGGQWLVAWRNQHIDQGGGGVLISREAHINRGFVGLVVAGRVALNGTARALISVSMPIAAAAVVGFGLGLLFGRASITRQS